MDGSLRLWDATAGIEQGVLVAAGANLTGFAFDPLERWLLTLGRHHVALWDMQTHKLGAKAEMRTAFLSAQFLPDGSGFLLGTESSAVLQHSLAGLQQGRAVAQGADGPIRFEPRTEVVPGGHSDTVWDMAASPDGRWIATASHDHKIKLWDTHTLELVRTLEGHQALVWCVAFSADSRYLASGSAQKGGGVIKVWEVATGRELYHVESDRALITALAFHPRRPWMVSGSGDGSVRAWDVEARRPLGLLHQSEQGVHGLAFRPDGRCLAATFADGRVALWKWNSEPALPAVPDQVLSGEPAGLWAVAFSPDGRTLATGCDHGIVVLRDGNTFDRSATLRSNTKQIRRLSFSHDGRLLAGAAYAGPILVWDLERLRRSLREMDLDW
jgi:WD40 repeat protein